MPTCTKPVMPILHYLEIFSKIESITYVSWDQWVIGTLAVNLCSADGTVLHAAGEIKDFNSDEEAVDEQRKPKPPLQKKGSVAMDLLVKNLVSDWRVCTWPRDGVYMA